MKRAGNSSVQRVLVVYKHPPTPSKRVPRGAAKEHLRTVEALYRLLQQRGLTFRAISIDQLQPIGSVDLVITVGGDGTLLATSHFVIDLPVLGIKSLGHPSVGHFCAATRDTMAQYLDIVVAGTRAPLLLNRLAAQVNGDSLRELILNDCLFAHGAPAGLTDYQLRVGRRSECQRSSGVWVSTAAGSSAAIRGAGGRVLPLRSRKLQYRVREPYLSSGRYELLGAVVPEDTVIRIESHSKHDTLSLDGSHIQYPIAEGSTVTIRRAHWPLKIYWK